MNEHTHKEFVKRLKERIFKAWQKNEWSYQLIKYEIDKLSEEFTHKDAPENSVCEDCGHSGEGDYHKGITEKGISYRQKLCWMDGCKCKKFKPKKRYFTPDWDGKIRESKNHSPQEIPLDIQARRKGKTSGTSGKKGCGKEFRKGGFRNSGFICGEVGGKTGIILCDGCSNKGCTNPENFDDGDTVTLSESETFYSRPSKTSNFWVWFSDGHTERWDDLRIKGELAYRGLDFLKTQIYFREKALQEAKETSDNQNCTNPK